MELVIDPGLVADARRLAKAIVEPVDAFIRAHSTVAVERAVLRLLEVDGTGPDDVPVPNLFLDRMGPERRQAGAAAWLGALVAETGLPPAEIGAALAAGSLAVDAADATPPAAARASLEPYVRRGLGRIAARRDERSRLARALAAGRRAAALRDRRERKHLRRPHRRRRRGRSRRADHRGHSLDRAVAARFRSVRPDDRRLRRHLRDAREFPHHARGAR